MRHGVVAALFILSFAGPALADDDEGAPATPPDSAETAPPAADSEQVTGPELVEAAKDLTDGYPAYKDPRTHLPADGKDCKDFVHDSYGAAGVDVGPKATASFQLEASPIFQRVAPGEQQPGDTIWQSRDGCDGDPNCGHVGRYSGADEEGTPSGYQQGRHGAQEIEFGGHGEEIRYYRPKTTDELEQTIAGQLDQLLPQQATTGQQADESDQRAAERQLEDTLTQAVAAPPAAGELPEVDAGAISDASGAAEGVVPAR